MKSLKDIALNITEEEYRNDGFMHYSTLATYERGGFNCLETLFEKKESPSLVFGSAVDAIITGGYQEFNDKFMIAEFPVLSDNMLKIVNALFESYSTVYSSLEEIPTSILSSYWIKFDGRKWKAETQAATIIKEGNEYYRLKYISGDKIIISTKLYEEVIATVNALKESNATRWYFAEDNPFDDIERVYQPKFKATIDGITYSCMMDLVIISHKDKIIYPCDLKTSSHAEWDFYESFIQWSYYIQASEYAAILKANIENDEYFKDFKIMPYRFIVANKKTLTPLVWEWNHTFDEDDIVLEKPNGYKITLRNFKNIGKELYNYLNNKSVVPNGISLEEPNNIEKWITK